MWLAAVAFFLGLCVIGFLNWVAQVRHNQSGEALSALKLDMLQYAEDNDGRLPPMRVLAQFHAAVMPYAKSESVFHVGDDDSHLVLPNPRVSGRKVSDVTRLTVLLYESKPARIDDSRWVAILPENAIPATFGDPDFRGLELVKEADWQRLKAANGIP